MVTNCKAGIYLTPSFEASQVVPQKKLTQHNANIGNPMASILPETAFCIFALTFIEIICNKYSKNYSNIQLETGNKYMKIFDDID